MLAYQNAQISSAEPIDEVSSYFGLRKIEVQKHPSTGHPAFCLNDKPIFQLGTLDQGWWPDGLHTPPSDEAMVYEIEFLKAAGFNTLRKHIKVEPARYYYHCDRLGILVWQDIPSGFLPAQFVAPNDEGDGKRSHKATQAFETQMQEIVHTLQPFPSIVMWVLHNEGWGQFDTQRLTDRIKSLHPNTWLNSTSGWLDVGVGDVIDRHDYEPQPTAPAPDGKRVAVIGEYGGVGWPISDHLWDNESDNWGYQTLKNAEEVQLAYKVVTQQIIQHAQNVGLGGAIYTQTTDVEGEVNGLITYDREVEKFPREWLADLHRVLTS